MKHKPSCAIYDPCPSQCDCGAPTDYQQGFQAGAASRDAEIAKLKEQNWELISEKAPALVAVRKERDQLRAELEAAR